jgi:hypothetical protein
VSAGDLVVIESPFAGDSFKEVERNISYARSAMRDSLLQGEAPFASHLLYTQPGVLDDTITDERTRGIKAGLLWGYHAKRVAVYTDLGISKGMRLGIEHAQRNGTEVVFRSLSGWGWVGAL